MSTQRERQKEWRKIYGVDFMLQEGTTIWDFGGGHTFLELGYMYYTNRRLHRATSFYRCSKCAVILPHYYHDRSPQDQVKELPACKGKRGPLSLTES